MIAYEPLDLGARILEAVAHLAVRGVVEPVVVAAVVLVSIFLVVYERLDDCARKDGVCTRGQLRRKPCEACGGTAGLGQFGITKRLDQFGAAKRLDSWHPSAAVEDAADERALREVESFVRSCMEPLKNVVDAVSAWTLFEREGEQLIEVERRTSSERCSPSVAEEPDPRGVVITEAPSAARSPTVDLCYTLHIAELSVKVERFRRGRTGRTSRMAFSLYQHRTAATTTTTPSA
ncbi:MAG: hypothetical protein KIT31_42400 [Deltaproteobacteria bacterium]|nr:hypothetical protein [Deltaproteobacteria bacterium]